MAVMHKKQVVDGVCIRWPCRRSLQRKTSARPTVYRCPADLMQACGQQVCGCQLRRAAVSRQQQDMAFRRCGFAHLA